MWRYSNFDVIIDKFAYYFYPIKNCDSLQGITKSLTHNINRYFNLDLFIYSGSLFLENLTFYQTEYILYTFLFVISYFFLKKKPIITSSLSSFRYIYMYVHAYEFIHSTFLLLFYDSLSLCFDKIVYYFIDLFI